MLWHICRRNMTKRKWPPYLKTVKTNKNYFYIVRYKKKKICSIVVNFTSLGKRSCYPILKVLMYAEDIHYLLQLPIFFFTSLSCDRRNLSVYSSVKHCKHLAFPAPSLTSHKEKVESSVNKEFINYGRILLQITRNKTFQLLYAS